MLSAIPRVHSQKAEHIVLFGEQYGSDDPILNPGTDCRLLMYKIENRIPMFFQSLFCFQSGKTILYFAHKIHPAIYITFICNSDFYYVHLESQYATAVMKLRNGHLGR